MFLHKPKHHLWISIGLRQLYELCKDRLFWVNRANDICIIHGRLLLGNKACLAFGSRLSTCTLIAFFPHKPTIVSCSTSKWKQGSSYITKNPATHLVPVKLIFLVNLEKMRKQCQGILIVPDPPQYIMCISALVSSLPDPMLHCWIYHSFINIWSMIDPSTFGLVYFFSPPVNYWIIECLLCLTNSSAK